MKYTYISSKLTGLDDLNRAGFREKAAELEQKGHFVWNPRDHQPVWASQWWHFITDDIEMMARHCDSIYLFGRWYNSQGALIELLAAHRMGLEIQIEQAIFAPLVWWLNRKKAPIPL